MRGRTPREVFGPRMPNEEKAAQEKAGRDREVAVPSSTHRLLKIEVSKQEGRQEKPHSELKLLPWQV